jgi:hypothetical protein
MGVYGIDLLKTISKEMFMKGKIQQIREKK